MPLRSETESRVWLLLDHYMPLVGLGNWECVVEVVDYDGGDDAAEVIPTPANLMFRLRVFRPEFDNQPDREQRVSVLHELRHVGLAALLDGLHPVPLLEEQECELMARILEAHLPRP